jgi:hypothetical protein
LATLTGSSCGRKCGNCKWSNGWNNTSHHKVSMIPTKTWASYPVGRYY